MVELVKMWILVEVLGILCLPLTVTVFHNLPDRGWAFSKALAMTVFAFAVWFPLVCIHALPYSQPFVWGVGLILAAGSAVGFWFTYRSIVTFLRRNTAYIVFTEVVFLGVVALLGILRQFRPDIRSWETFMDEGIIAGIMRSPHLPPNDVWYSGFAINYYYYAHFMIATLGKLIGQAPSIVFNTGISIFFALTAVNLFGATCNIVAWGKHVRIRTRTDKSAPDKLVEPASQSLPALLGAVPFGLCSLAMGVLFGNLASAGQWWATARTASGVYDWFAPSRVIPSTINEFPAFSFLLADFHAHVLTLAFTLLAIGVAFNLLLEHDGLGLRAFGHGKQLPFTLFASALVLGQLFAMNGWDLPTYLGLALVAIALQQWFAYKHALPQTYIVDVIVTWLTLIALTFLLFLPFYASYIVPTGGLGLVKPADRSAFPSELLIYGLFLFLFVSLLVASIKQRPLFRRKSAIVLRRSKDENIDVDQKQKNKRLARYILFSMLAVLLLNVFILLLLHNSLTFVIMGDIVLGGAALLWYHKDDSALAFALLLGTLAFALVAGSEIVYLRDLFESIVPRMNTVFKFYFQAWILLSVACGSGLFFILEALWQGGDASIHITHHEPPSWLQRGIAMPWTVCLTLLVGASLIYPLVAPTARLSTYNAQTRTMAMNPTWSLDGMTYLQTCRPYDLYPSNDSDPVPFCQYDVTRDYAAIRWINAHIQGDPTLVEATNPMSRDYNLYGLVSSFTGLPTLMEWPGHEVQWRNGWLKNPANAISFNQRLADISTIYTSPDPRTVLGLMRSYNAQYLYVGSMEYVTYPRTNLKRFASFMQTVYDQDGVAIYKVN